jgi:hypothetical protein
VFKKLFRKLFGRRRRGSVEDTSEIDVISRGVSGSGGHGFSNGRSSSQYLDGNDYSPQTSVMTTDARKKFRRL